MPDTPYFVFTTISEYKYKYNPGVPFLSPFLSCVDPGALDSQCSNCHCKAFLSTSGLRSRSVTHLWSWCHFQFCDARDGTTLGVAPLSIPAGLQTRRVSDACTHAPHPLPTLGLVWHLFKWFFFVRLPLHADGRECGCTSALQLPSCFLLLFKLESFFFSNVPHPTLLCCPVGKAPLWVY